jgi:hypothetical protein
MERPTIFLSSTIYDFRDLRSALKDHLERRGCRVLASEFNDFTKPLDQHSYQACLDTIEQADLFVLLIGSRVGGFVDEANKISITRAEYTRAYDLAKDNRIRLLTFVRSEVWTYRQSVKELQRHLKEVKSLSAEQKSAVAHHPTEFMTDAEAIIAFIDEVSRNRETAAAARGQGVVPIANWIHTFSTFADVREAIDPLIASGLTVSQAAGRKALQVQLLLLMKGLVLTGKNGPRTAETAVRRLVVDLNLKSDRLLGPVDVSEETWTRFIMLATQISKAKADPSSLQAVLASDLLLAYTPSDGKFHPTDEYDLLARVVEGIHALNFLGKHEVSDLFEYGRAADASKKRSVPAHLLATHMQRLLRWAELVSCVRALILSLEGQLLVLPAAMPRTPLLDQEGELALESVTLDQIRVLVGLSPRPDPATAGVSPEA